MSSLYLKHFDLQKAPFQITPEFDFFFSGSQRGGILNALLHVAAHEEGIVTVVAEVGSGKTLLARMMIARLSADISTVYLANPCFGRDEIISAICRDLGVPVQSGATEENLARLQTELLQRHAAGQRVILVIDEAHAMPPESLEEVRLLSNLETEQHKLVNIMLFGQPELDDLLADRRLRQVRDRVIHRFELPPLTAEEVAAYIDHRLRIAGWSGSRLFTAGAMTQLVKLSQGRARRINLLADKALLAAYAEAGKQVEKRHVVGAHTELHPDLPINGWRLPLPWRYALASVGMAVAMAVGMVAALGGLRAPPAEAAVRQEVSAAVPPPSPAAVTASVAAEPQTAVASPAADIADATSKVRTREWRSKLGEVVSRTDELVADPAKQGFTLQLASIPSFDHLPGYLGMIGPATETHGVFAHQRSYQGNRSVAVYLGDYRTEAEARAALQALPDNLKANRPILRTWAGIRREPLP